MGTSYQNLVVEQAGRRKLRTGMVAFCILVALMFLILPVAATPTAKFSVSPTKGDVPLTVKITRSGTCDATPCEYEWDFGDGNDSYSTTKSTFSHKFKETGVFTITLTMTNDDEEVDTAVKNVTVEKVDLDCSFKADVTEGAAPLKVKFTDESEGDIEEWAWDFDDGDDSDDQNPTHTFEDTGEYEVTLTITDSDGEDEDCSETITVTDVDKPVAKFVASATTGTAPLTVTFTDTSDNDPTEWFWTFGDGTTASNQNPSHTYTGAGTYSVTLKVTNDAGSNTVTKTQLITISPKTTVPTTMKTTVRTMVPTTIPTTIETTAQPGFFDDGISWPIVAAIVIVAVVIIGFLILRKGRGGMGRWDL